MRTIDSNDEPILNAERTADSDVPVCADCGVELDDKTGRKKLEDGRIVCGDCFDNYGVCAGCERHVLEDSLEWWGDCRLCPECMAEHVPSFDEEDNEEETAEEYEEMRERIIGRQTEDLEPGANDLTFDVGDETEQVYSLTVTVDENGIITDVSRLTCEILLSESITSSNWHPYPIDGEDYDWIVDEMLIDYLVDDDEDED